MLEPTANSRRRSDDLSRLRPLHRHRAVAFSAWLRQQRAETGAVSYHRRHARPLDGLSQDGAICYATFPCSCSTKSTGCSTWASCRGESISRCPNNRQTLFFSATVPPEIQAVASFALRNPTRVEIGVSRSVTSSVNHAIYPVAFEQKFDLLLALLAKDNFDSVLVFSRTKHGADRVARRLKTANHSVALHHTTARRTSAWRRSPVSRAAVRNHGGDGHRGARHRHRGVTHDQYDVPEIGTMCIASAAPGGPRRWVIPSRRDARAGVATSSASSAELGTAAGASHKPRSPPRRSAPTAWHGGDPAPRGFRRFRAGGDHSRRSGRTLSGLDDDWSAPGGPERISG